MDNKQQLEDCTTESASLEQNSKALSAIVGQVSHAFSTKVATLRMKQKILQEVLPILLKSYHLAVEGKLTTSEITKRHFKALDDVANLEEQITPMTDLLNSLNDYCNQLSADSTFNKGLSANQYIEALLNSYPYKDAEQRSLVAFESGEDFHLYVSPVFIENLLRNLLENALDSIEKMSKGTVCLWISIEKNECLLHVKDTGHGMDEMGLSRVYPLCQDSCRLYS